MHLISRDIRKISSSIGGVNLKIVIEGGSANGNEVPQSFFLDHSTNLSNGGQVLRGPTTHTGERVFGGTTRDHPVRSQAPRNWQPYTYESCGEVFEISQAKASQMRLHYYREDAMEQWMAVRSESALLEVDRLMRLSRKGDYSDQTNQPQGCYFISFTQPELITDILSRQPVKSLLCFLSVSKACFSLPFNESFYQTSLHQSIKILFKFLSHAKVFSFCMLLNRALITRGLFSTHPMGSTRFYLVHRFQTPNHFSGPDHKETGLGLDSVHNDFKVLSITESRIKFLIRGFVKLISLA